MTPGPEGDWKGDGAMSAMCCAMIPRCEYGAKGSRLTWGSGGWAVSAPELSTLRHLFRSVGFSACQAGTFQVSFGNR